MADSTPRKIPFLNGGFGVPGGIPGGFSVAALMLAAFVLAATLRTALADQATGEIKSTLSQVWMFSEIATRHVDAEQDAAWGAFGNGFEAARAIDNPWGRAWAFGKLASTLIELVNPGKGTLTKLWQRPPAALPLTWGCSTVPQRLMESRIPGPSRLMK